MLPDSENMVMALGTLLLIMCKNWDNCCFCLYCWLLTTDFPETLTSLSEFSFAGQSPEHGGTLVISCASEVPQVLHFQSFQYGFMTSAYLYFTSDLQLNVDTLDWGVAFSILKFCFLLRWTPPAGDSSKTLYRRMQSLSWNFLHLKFNPVLVRPWLRRCTIRDSIATAWLDRAQGLNTSQFSRDIWLEAWTARNMSVTIIRGNQILPKLDAVQTGHVLRCHNSHDHASVIIGQLSSP